MTKDPISKNWASYGDGKQNVVPGFWKEFTKKKPKPKKEKK